MSVRFPSTETKRFDYWIKDGTDTTTGAGSVNPIRTSKLTISNGYGAGLYRAWANDINGSYTDAETAGFNTEYTLAGLFDNVTSRASGFGSAYCYRSSLTVPSLSDATTPIIVGLDLPREIVLKSYAVTNWNSEDNSSSRRQSPRAWELYGYNGTGSPSVSGILIHTVTSSGFGGQGQTITYDTSSNTEAYSGYYLRILRANTWNNDTPNTVTIHELAFYGEVLEYPPTTIANANTWYKDPNDRIEDGYLNNGSILSGQSLRTYKTTVIDNDYGNGQYRAFSNDIFQYLDSSSYNTNEWPASGAFDKAEGSTGTQLSSHSGRGTFSSTVDADPAMELGVDIPDKIILTSYSVKNRTGFQNQSPIKWNLYGRNGVNGTEDLIDSQSGLSWTSGETKTFTISGISKYYDSYIFKFLRVQSGTDFIAIYTIKLYGLPFENKDSLEYPPAVVPKANLWTKDANDTVAANPDNATTTTPHRTYKTTVTNSLYGNGEYRAWANSIFTYTDADTYATAAWPASGAFDKLVGTNNTNESWSSDAYTMTNASDVTNPAIIGLDMPDAILLTRYTLGIRSDSIVQAPIKWSLYGRNGVDEEATLLDSQSSVTWNHNGQVRFYNVSLTQYYSGFYFEIYRINSASLNFTSLSEIKFYGTPLIREYPSTAIGASTTWVKDASDRVYGFDDTVETNLRTVKTTVTGQSYGNGEYRAWTDDWYSGYTDVDAPGAEWPPSGAFDKVDTDTGNNAWHNGRSAFSKTSDTWPRARLGIDLPEKIVLKYYTIANRLSVPTRGPLKWNVYGTNSNGDIDWNLIKSHNFVSGWDSERTKTFYCNATKAYARYVFEFIRSNETSVMTINLQEIKLFGTPEILNNTNVSSNISSFKFSEFKSFNQKSSIDEVSKVDSDMRLIVYEDQVGTEPNFASFMKASANQTYSQNNYFQMSGSTTQNDSGILKFGPFNIGDKVTFEYEEYVNVGGVTADNDIHSWCAVSPDDLNLSRSTSTDISGGYEIRFLRYTSSGNNQAVSMTFDGSSQIYKTSLTDLTWNAAAVYYKRRIVLNGDTGQIQWWTTTSTTPNRLVKVYEADNAAKFDIWNKELYFYIGVTKWTTSAGSADCRLRNIRIFANESTERTNLTSAQLPIRLSQIGSNNYRSENSVGLGQNTNPSFFWGKTKNYISANSGEHTIYFPTQFKETPVVFVTYENPSFSTGTSQELGGYIRSVTKTHFVYNSGSATRNFIIHWLAVKPGTGYLYGLRYECFRGTGSTASATFATPFSSTPIVLGSGSGEATIVRGCRVFSKSTTAAQIITQDNSVTDYSGGLNNSSDTIWGLLAIENGTGTAGKIEVFDGSSTNHSAFLGYSGSNSLNNPICLCCSLYNSNPTGIGSYVRRIRYKPESVEYAIKEFSSGDGSFNAETLNAIHISNTFTKETGRPIVHLDVNTLLDEGHSHNDTITTWKNKGDGQCERFVAPNGAILQNSTARNGWEIFLDGTAGERYFDTPTGVDLTWNFRDSVSQRRKGVTAFFVGYLHGPINYGRIFDFGNGQQNDNILWCRQSTNNTARLDVNVGTTNRYVEDTTVNYWETSNDNMAVYAVKYDNSAGDITFYKNDTSTTYATTIINNTLATEKLDNRTTTLNYIGRSNWPADPDPQLSIQELIVYNESFDEDRIKKTIRELTQKWFYSKYTLLFRQTHPYFFASQSSVPNLNANDPFNDNYSIMQNLENYRDSNGRFRFRFVGKKYHHPDTPTGATNEWYQTSNPNTTSDSVTGYEAISIDGSGQSWGGLALSASSATIIDGSPGNSNWYYALGLENLSNYLSGNAYPSIHNGSNEASLINELWVYNNPEPEYITTQDSGGYTLLFRQTLGYLWPDIYQISNLNPKDPSNDNYSIMKHIEDFRNGDGKFRFKYVNKGNQVSNDPGINNEWRQTSNPNTTFESSTGYEAIAINYTANWATGMSLSSNAETIIDMTVGGAGWWGQIGAIANYSGAFAGLDAKAVNIIELWVLKEN